MKISKILLAILITAICTVGIFITYKKIYPVYTEIEKLRKAENITFDIDYNIIEKSSTEDADFNITDSILPLLKNGKIHLDYDSGVIHGLVYPEGFENALLDFYYDDNEEIIINVRQAILSASDYVTDKTMLPINMLVSLIDSQECYVSEKQFEEITGVRVLPDDFSDIPSKFDLFKLIARKKNIQLKDSKYEMNLTITYEIPEKDKIKTIRVPETSFDDNYIWILKMIFDKLMDKIQ